jgi:saccharopine dehydrogenase (NAD+, L-lysine-forming)
VAVLGAGGTIGPVIVRDLAESSEVGALRLLDIDEQRAADVARASAPGKDAAAQAVDASDRDALAAALEGVDVLINSASYRLNLEVMEACLRAGCHYLDLGGLYWMTERQLELDPAFSEAGLLAVLGIGSSPGKTNLMALAGVRAVGEDAEVDSIDVSAAGRDARAPNDGQLRPPYAIQTLLDELTLEPVVIRDGESVRVPPLSPGGEVQFGEPIGAGETIFTLHSEMATFRQSFGCRNGSFRLSLTPTLLKQLEALVGADAEEVQRAQKTSMAPSNETVSVHLVTVSTQDGRGCAVRSVSRPHFGLGGSVVSTAAPPAATVRLMARGSVQATGVRPPERCLDPSQMFEELAARGCTITLEDYLPGQ